MTPKKFIKGWRHFLDCLNFDKSNLDAEAIGFMNEMPGEVFKALTSNAKSKRPSERNNPK